MDEKMAIDDLVKLLDSGMSTWTMMPPAKNPRTFRPWDARIVPERLWPAVYPLFTRVWTITSKVL